MADGDGERVIPLGRAAIKRPGRDITIVALSIMVQKTLQVAEQLCAEGIDAEVVDPQTILPLDRETIFASVRKTRRLVVVHEAVQHGGVGAEIVASVVEHCMSDMDAPPVRVAAKNLPLPFAPEMERLVLPNGNDIVQAVRRICRA